MGRLSKALGMAFGPKADCFRALAFGTIAGLALLLLAELWPTQLDAFTCRSPSVLLRAIRDAFATGDRRSP
jgi:hypothetical protein